MKRAALSFQAQTSAEECLFSGSEQTATAAELLAQTFVVFYFR